MLWGIIPHSWVLIAKEVEDNFHKMIRIGNRRLNITLLINLQTYDLCCYKEILLRPRLSRTHVDDRRPVRRKPILPGHHPWRLLGFIPGACLLHCPGLVPLWLPRAWGRTSLLRESMLQIFLYSQRASHCLWNSFSVCWFPVPNTTDGQLIKWVQGSHTEMTTGVRQKKWW